jgi:hypothetical protein
MKKTKTLAEVWTNGELRLSFRMAFSAIMLQNWGELCAVVEQLTLNDGYDVLVWCYDKLGVYSSHFFYVVINYRGVSPVYIPTVWNILVPPKIQLMCGFYLTAS